MIPLFTLERQNKILKKELEEQVAEVIRRGVFILGEKVAEFEEEFAEYLGVKYAVGVASGTDALSLALLAIGVDRGDEVILPANAYPTAFAVTSIGAIPKLVDIDEQTYNIDPKKISRAISRKTRAIVPVHLYGQPADIKAIVGIGNRYKIPVIEDCAQAHGAKIRMGYKGGNAPLPPLKVRGGMGGMQPPLKVRGGEGELLKVGTIGDAGCFSFYPTKNLGCFGDGGMVVTGSRRIYEKVKLLRMYGEKKRYHSVVVGRNSRLDELQAAILLVKLKYLDKWNEKRREIAGLYVRFLARRQNFLAPLLASPAMRDRSKSDLRKFCHAAQKPDNEIKRGIILPWEVPYGEHIYHLFVVRTNKRDELKNYLETQGIATAIHYPKPIHLQPSFKYLGYKEGDFPHAEKASREILSLPMFPELTNKEVKTVAGAITDFS